MINEANNNKNVNVRSINFFLKKNAGIHILF